MEEERVAIHGLGSNDFVITPTIEIAYFAVVPVRWTYYLKHKKVHWVIDMIEYARKENKKTLMHRPTVEFYRNILESLMLKACCNSMLSLI